MKTKLRRPTFAMLAQKRRLAVLVPETGQRFVISLRDWERVLWAVRVVPHEWPLKREDTFCTAHRLLDRGTIEEWLDRLILDPKPQRGLTVRLRDYQSKSEKEQWRWLRAEVAAGRLPESACMWPAADETDLPDPLQERSRARPHSRQDRRRQLA